MGNSTHPGGICPFLYRTLYNKDKCRALYNKTVVRRAKQGASYQVKDLLFQNLASRNYRVLQLC